MDIDDVRDWARPRVKRLFLTVGWGLFTIAALVLTFTTVLPRITGGDRAAAMITELQGQLDSTQQSLDEQHRQLISDIEGYDVDRVLRDQDLGEGLATEITNLAATDLGLGTQQLALRGAHAFLNEQSPLLTVFLAQWLEARGDQAVAYATNSVSVTLTSADDAGYGYQMLVEAKPLDESQPTQQFVMFYTVDVDGAVTSWDAELIAPGANTDAMTDETTDDADASSEQTDAGSEASSKSDASSATAEEQSQ